MTNWSSVRLTDVCDFEGGTQPPKETFKYEPFDGYVRMLQIQDFKTDNSAVYIPAHARMKTCNADDVMIARYGASIGRILRGKSGAYNVALVKTVPDLKKVQPDFLFHLLKGHGFQSFILNVGSRAAQAGFNKDELARFELVLPPLAEQRRIAGVLDAADALRAKRRDAIVRLTELSRAIFVDMFAGPASKVWEVSTIGAVANHSKASMRTGPFGSQLLHSEFVDEGIAVLGIDNVVSNEFERGKKRYITPAKYQQLKRYRVYPGDVLISIMGTCGRCAIVPDDIPVSINTKHLCCITMDQNQCRPAFLHSYFLQHPIALKYLRLAAKGAIMDGLNMGLIAKLPLLLPPAQLQMEFERRLAGINRVATALRASLAALDALFASLQHRAFRGEL